MIFFSQLGQEIIFSSLDLLSGYWPEVIAFSTPSEHYHWLRTPMGLSYAPMTCMKLINKIFSGMLGENIFAYLDDILVVSKDLPSHFTHLYSVWDTLFHAGLKVNVTKCSFLKTQIKFLGHMVDSEGIRTMDDKIKAVKKFPTPT